MNIEERLAQSQAKLDELKEKINNSIDSAKAAYQVDKKEAMIKLAKMNAAIEDFGRDVEAQVYCDVTSMQNEVKADTEAINKAMEDINDKIDATRLKVQMHREEVKNRIETKKTELDKAAQEELIMDLLDYADDCQMVAYLYAMEAELAIMDACDEIADYEAKYGKYEGA